MLPINAATNSDCSVNLMIFPLFVTVLLFLVVAVVPEYFSQRLCSRVVVVVLLLLLLLPLLVALVLLLVVVVVVVVVMSVHVLSFLGNWTVPEQPEKKRTTTKKGGEVGQLHVAPRHLVPAGKIVTRVEESCSC